VAEPNKDGKLDLVTANDFGNDASVLLGNGDGRPDLVTPDYGNSTVTILLNEAPAVLPTLQIRPLGSQVELCWPAFGKGSEPNQTASGETGFIDEKQRLTKLPISRGTLGNWKARGILPYIKIGRRCLYDWASAQGALLRRQRGGQS
jgi:hypothetical protein